MSYSLLAHLYPYIKGSQEDIATFSLQYLLTQSIELNHAFTKRISNEMKIETDNTLQYACQVTGDSAEKERPDMVGRDADGKEILLFEMKFYASLTTNQPLTYLERLRKNSGKGLMFICPTIRKTNLWAKLKELCAEKVIQEISECCISVDGIKLAILTWSEILEMLKQVAASTDLSFISDINQLEGYCNKIDSDAFIPFSSDDLSALCAKKEERYYMVIDEVMELLLADTNYETSKKGTKATAYRKGYTRSLAINNYTITLNYDRDMWKNPASVETPFWVTVRDNNWTPIPEMSNIFKMLPEQQKEYFWDTMFLPLNPIQNVTLSELCDAIKTQILKYVDTVDTYLNNIS